MTIYGSTWLQRIIFASITQRSLDMIVEKWVFRRTRPETVVTIATGLLKHNYDHIMKEEFSI